MRVRRACAAVAVLLASGLLAACSDSGGDTPQADPSSSTAGPTRQPKPAKLTFGVFGGAEEVNAYRRVASSFNGLTDQSDVSVVPYADAAAVRDAVEAGEAPDVFLMSRSDLTAFTDDESTQPLSALLDERGVDIGDDYSRDALGAFSSDRDLQCMPYGTSPDVVYYNTRWVDFERMRERGLPVPSIDPEDPRQAPRWSFEMFSAAADFATRPRRNVAGLYVAPTLRGLAPFVYSGGGEIFDDDSDPTSLALSDDGSREALETVLPLLRDARLGLSAEQLARRTPLEWFERSRLAMMIGPRSLVPELRGVEGLDFDVLPTPVVDDDATVGDITGICVSAATRHTSEAADFLVHAISSDSVRTVVETGYLSPANQAVALSDAFLQPGQLPVHSSVFVASVRSMVVPPLLRDRQALVDDTSALVASLLTAPVLDIDAVTAAIDEESRAVLAPVDAEEGDGDGDSEAPEEPSEDDAG